MKLLYPVLAALLVLCCREAPRKAVLEEELQKQEDYSFEAVAVAEAEARQQAEAKLREQYKSEVQRCEKELQGEWLSPGYCCVGTAMGCEPQKL